MARQATQDPPVLVDVQDRLRAEVDRSWVASSLARWMCEHRAQFEQLLSSGLTWEGAAAHFACAGLIDAGGRAPSASTASETWRRLQLELQAAPRALPPEGRGASLPG
jgi:hypothetical protein